MPILSAACILGIIEELKYESIRKQAARTRAEIIVLVRGRLLFGSKTTRHIQATALAGDFSGSSKR